MNNYHQRFLSETTMYRYKQLISTKLSLRDYNEQRDWREGVKQSHKTRYACTPDNLIKRQKVLRLLRFTD